MHRLMNVTLFFASQKLSLLAVQLLFPLCVSLCTISTTRHCGIAVDLFMQDTIMGRPSSNGNWTLRPYRKQWKGTTVSISRATLTFCFLVLVFGLAAVMSTGCDQDAIAPTSAARLDQAQHSASGLSFASLGDTTECNTASGVLLPSATLELNLSGAKAKYPIGSVSQPTVVSFSICKLDTTGTPLRSKAAVFGPFSDQVFLCPFQVRLSLVDVGLPTNTPDRGYYKLFRLDELSGGWDSVQIGRIRGQWIMYQINRNGTYAITFDTTWVASGVISPGGGTLDLFNSTINFPPGALSESTLVSFRLTTGVTPVGLPGATDRVFDFSPDGIVFLIPVTLYVSFAEAGINEDEEKVPMLRFYYFDPTASTWVRQPTVIDWQSRRFIVTLSHFSRYAFGR
jgi:hypothetical protein